MFKSAPRAIFVGLSCVTFSACAPDLVTGTGASSNSTGGAGTGGMETSSSASSSGVGGASSSSTSSGSGGAQGSPCTGADDCPAALFCEDGVCCNQTCGECQSCNQTGFAGTCRPVAFATDDCSKDGQLCDDGGSCACGIALPPPKDAICLQGWDNSADGVCRYPCDQQDECKNKPAVTCPPGADCIIDCSGNGGCEGTTFNCPAGYACTLKCTNVDTCKNVVLNCSDDGPCKVECTVGGLGCAAVVNCGSNSCTALCTNASKPTLIPKPGTACLPTPCP